MVNKPLTVFEVWQTLQRSVKRSPIPPMSCGYLQDEVMVVQNRWSNTTPLQAKTGLKHGPHLLNRDPIKTAYPSALSVCGAHPNCLYRLFLPKHADTVRPPTIKEIWNSGPVTALLSCYPVRVPPTFWLACGTVHTTYRPLEAPPFTPAFQLNSTAVNRTGQHLAAHSTLNKYHDRKQLRRGKKRFTSAYSFSLSSQKEHEAET